jgi:hypothetical protein
MTSEQRILLSFEGLSSAEANRAAVELQSGITRLSTAPIQVDIVKESDITQDAGTTLVAVLSTGAAIAIAKGVQAYLMKRGSAVVIRTQSGEVIARGDAATNINVAKTVEALSRLQPKS